MSDVIGKRCTLCGKSQDSKFKPFCSKRCADLDLGQWLKGGYAIPGVEVSDESLGEDDGGETRN
jgi:endogenous inhibitor of DNA gyrase (YacG/DUF329 family)